MSRARASARVQSGWLPASRVSAAEVIDFCVHVEPALHAKVCVRGLLPEVVSRQLQEGERKESYRLTQCSWL